MTTRNFLSECVRVLNTEGETAFFKFVALHAPNWESVELARITVYLKRALNRA